MPYLICLAFGFFAGAAYNEASHNHNRSNMNDCMDKDYDYEHTEETSFDPSSGGFKRKSTTKATRNHNDE